MQIRCKNPNCGSTHFHASAHIVEHWVIDAGGHWLESLETGDVLNGPFVDEATCVCGSEVEVSYG